jgi:hypothetical protein
VFIVLRWLIISPLIASWHSRTDHIAALQKQIDDGKVLIGRQDFIRARWDRMSTNSLNSTPTAAERQAFDAFDRWVRTSGVTEGAFKPQLKDTDDNYSIMECRADVSGNLESILDFLAALGKDPLGMRLQSLELTSRDDNGQQLSLGLELDGLLLPNPNQ